jgi:hypothetical protein
LYPSCIQKKYEKVGWKARKAGGFAVYNSLGLLTSFKECFELRASEMNHDGKLVILYVLHTQPYQARSTQKNEKVELVIWLLCIAIFIFIRTMM